MNVKEYFTEHVAQIFADWKKSKNKASILIKYKNFLTAMTAITTLVFGFFGMLGLDQTIVEALINTLQLFALNFPSNVGNSIPVLIASISAVLTVFLVAVMYFLKDFFEKIILKSTYNNKHTVIFGLSSVSRKYLDSIGSNPEKNIIVIESDPKNQYIETYKQNDFAVVIADAFSDYTIDTLNFETMQYAIVSIGEDRKNIELAKKIMTKYKTKKIYNKLKLLVHIRSKELSYLFHESFVSTQDKENNKIEIKLFSFFEEASNDLFDKYHIDGDTLEYIHSAKPFNSIVMGDGELVKHVLYKMAMLSNLPNENVHTVSVVDKDAEVLVKKLKKYLNYSAEKFPSFKLEAIKLDLDSLEYAKDQVWCKQDLVNLIICYDEEKRNLDLAVELYNRVYIAIAVDKQPKVIFGMYNEILMSKAINENKGKFKNFYTFGEASTILCHQNLADEENEKIAKLVHSGYGQRYDKKASKGEKDIETKWYESAKFSHKLSNKAQAKHIDIKLKALGLAKIEAKEISEVALLDHNLTILYKALEKDFNELGLSEEKILEYSKVLEKPADKKEYEVAYFPEKFSTMFEKLMRSEHNRWNSYYFLNGWEFSETGNDTIKRHNCLIPLKDFDDKSIKITILYDMYSILYIPNYLAQTQYKIVKYECA